MRETPYCAPASFPRLAPSLKTVHPHLPPLPEDPSHPYASQRAKAHGGETLPAMAIQILAVDLLAILIRVGAHRQRHGDLRRAVEHPRELTVIQVTEPFLPAKRMSILSKYLY